MGAAFAVLQVGGQQIDAAVAAAFLAAVYAGWRAGVARGRPSAWKPIMMLRWLRSAHGTRTRPL